MPPAVVTDTIPVTAPGMTMPSSVDPSLETEIAETPPMVKPVGVPRLVPVMVTRVPTGPDDGVNDAMVGAGKGINAAAAPLDVFATEFPEQKTTIEKSKTANIFFISLIFSDPV